MWASWREVNREDAIEELMEEDSDGLAMPREIAEALVIHKEKLDRRAYFSRQASIFWKTSGRYGKIY